MIANYLPQQNTINEKCAVVGVWTSSDNASHITRRALVMLQHRGQESTGITVWQKKQLKTLMGMGLVPQVLTDKNLSELGKSHAAIGHNRYSTAGDSTLVNAHPITLSGHNFWISIAHNGNIPDTAWLEKNIQAIPSANSDTSLIAQLLLEKRLQFNNWEETFIHVLANVQGAFSLTILTEDGSVYGVRDPWGIRPLVLGKLQDGWIIASETVATDSLGAHFVRDIKPGEIVKIGANGLVSSYYFGPPKRQKFCIFENIYFSRPDSFFNGIRIRSGREESGIRLGIRMKRKHIRADVVVPIFDSGYPAAKGVAQALGLPIVEAVTTSHFVGRTFIQPGQLNRVIAVGDKHTVIPDGILGKKVVFVDDSAVRLTTSMALTRALKRGGAREVYAAFASPPIVHHCDLGIDLKTKSELPAAKWAKSSLEITEKEVAKLIAADEVIYLPIEETAEAMGGTPNDFYYTPFGGPHPVRGKQEIFKKRLNTKNKPRICVFISGSGTNLQEIINQVASGYINAEIVGVIANSEDAFGITRAKKHNIATIILPSKGKTMQNTKRAKYEETLFKEIIKFSPDLIVLAGWMLVLGDVLLKKLQKMQITVINLHPALLTQRRDELVPTSRGIIPIIRGTHAIRDAYIAELPVSGVTVQQVVAGNFYDVGPVILKEEVRREQNDTLQMWEKKMHEAEHRVLPTAIKRVLHVFSYNIDVSKGDFPW